MPSFTKEETLREEFRKIYGAIPTFCEFDQFIAHRNVGPLRADKIKAEKMEWGATEKGPKYNAYSLKLEDD